MLAAEDTRLKPIDEELAVDCKCQSALWVVLSTLDVSDHVMSTLRFATNSQQERTQARTNFQKGNLQENKPVKQLPALPCPS